MPRTPERKGELCNRLSERKEKGEIEMRGHDGTPGFCSSGAMPGRSARAGLGGRKEKGSGRFDENAPARMKMPGVAVDKFCRNDKMLTGI